MKMNWSPLLILKLKPKISKFIGHTEHVSLDHSHIKKSDWAFLAFVDK